MDTIDLRNAHKSIVTGRHVDNLQALMIPILSFVNRRDLISGLVKKGTAEPDGKAGAGTAEALEAVQNACLYFGKSIGSSRADRICGDGSWKSIIEF